MNIRTLFNKPLTVWDVIFVLGVTCLLLWLAGKIGYAFWLFEYTSNLQIQYTVFLFGVSGVLLVGRKYVYSGIIGLFAGILLVEILWFFMPAGKVVTDTSSSYRMYFLNVHLTQTDYAALNSSIRKYNPDLFFLVESDDRLIKNLGSLEVDYPYQKKTLTEGHFGISLFSKMPFSSAEVKCFGIAINPSISVRYLLQGKPVQLVALHLMPPGEHICGAWRESQFRSLGKWLQSVEEPVMVAGDFNVTPWSYLYKQLIKETSLINSSRSEGMYTTWPGYLKFSALQIPIDHCLHSMSVTVIRSFKGENAGSDHYPVIVDFTL
ncbi:MAG: endonuclease/exonuclease/phosphatase family protein [Fibrobacteria bacterium]|nr:endonuclease/exonuclease/phosphatase family protein [Fibrobacteria bacterium]